MNGCGPWTGTMVVERSSGEAVQYSGIEVMVTVTVRWSASSLVKRPSLCKSGGWGNTITSFKAKFASQTCFVGLTSYGSLSAQRICHGKGNHHTLNVLTGFKVGSTNNFIKYCGQTFVSR